MNPISFTIFFFAVHYLWQYKISSQLAPGSGRFVAGLKPRDVRIAEEYLKTQIKTQLASDLLTTGLNALIIVWRLGMELSLGSRKQRCNL